MADAVPATVVVGPCPVTPRLARLSARQLEVTDLLARGLEEREIAKVLFISVNTVKTHIRDAREAMAARNRAHLVALTFRSGQLPLVPDRAAVLEAVRHG